MTAAENRYQKRTHDIVVSVSPYYLEEQSSSDEDHYVWAYAVEITNEGDKTVQLQDRYWRIVDAAGKVEEVNGPGVVGEQPILDPGDRFNYTSSCPLSTPSGFMAGYYVMTTQDGVFFEVDIPAFSLDLPDHRATVN